MAKKQKTEVIQNAEIVPATFQQESESVESRIEFEIQKYGLPEARISELKEKFKDLEIQGIEDKTGMKQVSEALSIVRTLRTSVEKKRKELKDFYLNTGKGIDSEAKRLTELLLEVEDPLKEKKQAIEDEIQRIKDEEERIQQELLDKRVEDLKEAGIVFDGSFYSIGNDISVDLITIKDLSSEDFQKLLDKVSEVNEKLLQERIIQEKHEARKEVLLPFWSFMSDNLRIAHFGHIEDQEFESILSDLMKQQEKFDADIRKQKEEAERLEAEKIQFNSERNIFKLEKLGFEEMENGNFGFKNEAGFHIVMASEIQQNLTDFQAVFEKAEAKKEKLIKDAELKKIADQEKAKKEAQEAKDNSRIEILKRFLPEAEFSEGVYFDYAECRIEISKLLKMSDEEFSDKTFEIRQRLADYAVKLDQEAEAEKISRLSDIEKVERYCEEIMKVSVFQISSDRIAEEFAELRRNIKLAVENTKSNLNKLK